LQRAPAHREIPQALTDEPQHLVALRVGLHSFGVRRVMLEQGVLEAGQLEEVVLLADVFDRTTMDGALAVDQLVLGVIGLTGDASARARRPPPSCRRARCGARRSRNRSVL